MQAKNKIKQELNEKLYRMYKAKHWQDYNGSIEKYECTINKEHGLFKERVSRQSKDHIMEQVAYEIANILGVRCCKASCRKVNGLYGAFSRFEVQDIRNIIPYESIIGTAELSADELMKRTIVLTKGRYNSFVLELYQFIIFDYILGQMDRHMENLSVYRTNKRQTIWYPLYDNGLCCFSTFGNDAAVKYMDMGYFSSRLGFSEEILQCLVDYRHLIYPGDLREIVRYHLLNENVLGEIIDKSNKYNQLTLERRNCTIKFIMNNIREIDRLNMTA